MATAEQHAAAVLAALNAVLNAASMPRYAYDFDEIPATRPKDYVEVSVTRRFGGESREDGYVGTTGWRILTRYVSEASVSNARLMQDKTRLALEFNRLSVAGDTTTPVNFETGEPIGADDDGWFTGLDTWTYTY